MDPYCISIVSRNRVQQDNRFETRFNSFWSSIRQAFIVSPNKSTTKRFGNPDSQIRTIGIRLTNGDIRRIQMGHPTIVWDTRKITADEKQFR